MSTDYTLVEPFGVDDGSLDGMPPQMCFCLGYELAQVHAYLESGRTSPLLIHATNRQRALDSASRRGVRVSTRLIHDDWCEITREDGVKDVQREAR